jgi:hypothetical protein
VEIGAQIVHMQACLGGGFVAELGCTASNKGEGVIHTW